MAAVASLILFPASLPRTLHNLSVLSWLAAVAIFGTVLVIMAKVLTSSSSLVVFEPAPVFCGNGFGLLRALPLIVFALNMHIQAVPIHTAVASAQRRRRLRTR